MSIRKWFILILAIVALMSLATYAGATGALFVDNEESSDDALGFGWGLTTLDDEFEDTPWDANWDENDSTAWQQSDAQAHSGTYSARGRDTESGYLTSDDLYASSSTNITLHLWFYPKNIEAGDLLIESFNGSSWNTIYDLTAYPTYADTTWCEFSEVITDSQYFIAGLRIRFNNTGMVDTDDAAWIDGVLVVTDSIPPSAPTGLAATLGEEQVTLDWNDNSESDLDGYNVYRSLTSGANFTQINGSLVETSDYVDTGLTNDITYYYVVSAVDLGSNESGYSSEDNAIPTDLPPAAPTGLVATGWEEEVELDWSNNGESDLDGYNVYRSLTSGDNYTKINGSLVATSNFTDTGLTNDVTYYYVVTAVDLSVYESSTSSEDSATPTDLPPAVPTSLVATAGDKQATLNWADNSDTDLDGYNVYRSTTSGSGYSKINGSLVSTSNYTDTGLTGGTTYYYVVTAVDLGSNESGYSNEDSTTPTDPAPSAPTGLAATPGDRQAILDWNDNSEGDLDGYNVYRSLTSGANFTQINGSLVSTSNYTNTELTGGTTYYYVVTAVDLASHESAYSAQDSATPTDLAPAAPTGLA
ncbi:fibronectin type III domain-containing protein, partial [Chloroflexota bacterium]